MFPLGMIQKATSRLGKGWSEGLLAWVSDVNCCGAVRSRAAHSWWVGILAGAYRANEEIRHYQSHSFFLGQCKGD